MVAGMLTAIKAFVKDAFTAETQELETIAYETYKIIIKNFKSYYIAAVISGVVTTSSKKELDHAILDFSEKVLTTPKLAQLPDSQEKISQSLKAHFSKFNRHEGQ
jgi:hypothetical protein